MRFFLQASKKRLKHGYASFMVKLRTAWSLALSHTHSLAQLGSAFGQALAWPPTLAAGAYEKFNGE